MTAVIQTGEQIITASELIPLLTNYQMLPLLITQYIVDETIATIECTPEEIATASQQFALSHRLTTETEKT